MKRKNTIEEIEKLFEVCKSDLQKLKSFNQEIKTIQKNINKLKDYYNSQYLEDVEHSKNKSKTSIILDEDSIWNILADQNTETLKTIKFLIKNI